MNGKNPSFSHLIQRLNSIDGNHRCTDPLVGEIPQEFRDIFRPDYMEGDPLFLNGAAGKALKNILMNRECLVYDAYELLVDPPRVSSRRDSLATTFYTIHPSQSKIPLLEILKDQAKDEKMIVEKPTQLKKAAFNRNSDNVPIGWVVFPKDRVNGQAAENLECALVFVDRELYMKTKEMLNAPTVAPVEPPPDGNTRLPSDVPSPG